MIPKAIVAAILVGGLVAGGAIQRSQAHRAAVDPPGAITLPIIQYPPGVPAIVPSRSVADQSTSALTPADVNQYLSASPPFKPLSAGAGKAATIQFLPAGRVSQLLNGESIGRPDNAIVAYVVVQGPISTAGFPLPSGALMPPSSPKGTLVFDAQTGNLLVEGL